jgi:2,3,4,5-tetrahydropyridine-2-carboxylate N-succinyltransferase
MAADLVSTDAEAADSDTGLAALAGEIDRVFAAPPAAYGDEHAALFARFKAALNEGRARAAEPDPQTATGWRVNPWVKRGILLGFRLGATVDLSVGSEAGHRLPFFDKHTYPLRTIGLDDGVRLVPGGSSVRDGVYLGRGVTCMPPMFVNVGAWVDDGTMIDSHALVGSCAQVGRRVHLSAAAQLGGVLEPVGALPVIVEDEALVGGNCGVYEGTVVKRRAVLAAGVVLTRSTPVYDLVREVVHRAEGDGPLVIPEGAVVVPGARQVTRGKGPEWGLSLYAPVIVKYRDEGTDERTQLEDWLR